MPEPSWLPEGDSDRTIEANWLFRLRSERFRSRRSGHSHGFFVLHLADAVGVVAVTADRKVVLVRQFRAGSRADSLEPPGGLLNPGEDLLAAGARELLEETGYAGDPRLLGTSWANPSLLTARYSTIVIQNARKIADPTPDHGEEVEVELIDEPEILASIRDGRIDHSLAVLSFYAYLLTPRIHPEATA